jgi:hypothetical protein
MVYAPSNNQGRAAGPPPQHVQNPHNVNADRKAAAATSARQSHPNQEQLPIDEAKYVDGELKSQDTKGEPPPTDRKEKKGSDFGLPEFWLTFLRDPAYFFKNIETYFSGNRVCPCTTHIPSFPLWLLGKKPRHEVCRMHGSHSAKVRNKELVRWLATLTPGVTTQEKNLKIKLSEVRSRGLQLACKGELNNKKCSEIRAAMLAVARAEHLNLEEDEWHKLVYDEYVKVLRISVQERQLAAARLGKIRGIFANFKALFGYTPLHALARSEERGPMSSLCPLFCSDFTPMTVNFMVPPPHELQPTFVDTYTFWREVILGWSNMLQRGPLYTTRACQAYVNVTRERTYEACGSRDVYPMTGIGLFLFVHATAEEVFKRYFFKMLGCGRKMSMFLGAVLLSAYETLTRVGPALFVREFSVRFAVHGALTVMPLPLAAVTHTAVNYVGVCGYGVTRVYTDPPYEQWRGRNLMYAGPIILLACVAIFLFRRRKRPHRRVIRSINVHADMCIADHKYKDVKVSPYFEILKDGERICEPRFGTRRFFSVRYFRPTVFRSCYHNETISLEGRIGKFIPLHSSEIAQKNVEDRWNSMIKRHFPLYDMLIPFSHEKMNKYLWASTFPPRMRDILLKIFEEGLLVPKVLRADCFIKRELCLRDIRRLFEIFIKDPRMISSCPRDLSAAVGPRIRPFSKLFRESFVPWAFTRGDLSNFRQIIYTCGMSGEAIGMAFANAIQCMESVLLPGEFVVIVEDDQSRFDLHMLAGPFKFLRLIYVKKLGKKIAHYLRRETSRGRTKLGTTFKVPYTMQSGWPDTSVGDTLVNSIMKFEIHGPGRRWISIICGDDSVTVTIDTEIAWIGGKKVMIDKYASMGMEVTIDIRHNPLDVEFCSGRFLPVEDGYVLMPKVGKLIAKLGWDMEDRTPIKQQEWLRSISNTLIMFGYYDPLLRALGFRLQAISGIGPSIVKYNSYDKWVDCKATPSHDRLLEYYMHHYSIGQDELEFLIGYLGCFEIGEEFQEPTLIRMVERDA